MARYDVPPPARRHHPLTTRAPLLAAAAVIITIAVLGQVQTMAARRGAERQRLDDMISTVADSAQFYSREDWPRRITELATNAPFTLDGSPIDQLVIDTFATSPAGGPGSVAVLATPEGRPIVASPAGTALTVAPESPAWQAAVDGLGALDPYVEEPGGSRTWFVVPVQRDGRTAAIVALGLSTRTGRAQQLTQELGSMGLPSAGYSIVDADGVAFGSHDPGLVGQHLVDTTGLADLDGGSARVVSDGGTILIAGPMASMSVPEPVYLLFRQPADQFFHDLRVGQAQRDTVLYGLVLGSVAGLALLNHRRDRAVRRDERRLDALLQHAHDIVLVIDRDRRPRFVSSAIGPLLGFDPTDARLGPGLLHPGDRRRMAAAITEARAAGSGSLTDVRVRDVDGSYRWFDVDVADLRHHPDVQGFLLTCHEVGERKRLQDQLAYAATHDPLTGLPNRMRLAERLEHLAAGDATRSFAVLFVDLDHFKPVNDALGHDAGDEVLRTVARRLRATVRMGDEEDPGRDIVCRLGGDEFVIVLLDVNERRARATAERVIEHINEPIAWRGRTVRVGATIGVALSHPGDEHPDSAVRHADLAMYEAKQQGRGRYTLHRGRSPA